MRKFRNGSPIDSNVVTLIAGLPSAPVTVSKRSWRSSGTCSMPAFSYWSRGASLMLSRSASSALTEINGISALSGSLSAELRRISPSPSADTATGSSIPKEASSSEVRFNMIVPGSYL